MLVKMLMEIDPLPMKGSLVMTMAMISPSQREVSPAEQLRQSPRLVPPRFRLMAAESRPESWLMIFSSSKDSIERKMGIRGSPGGPRGRGRAQGVGHAPHPRGQGVGPLAFIFCRYFLYFPKSCSVKFQDFSSCTFSSPEFQLPRFSLFM